MKTVTYKLNGYEMRCALAAIACVFLMTGSPLRGHAQKGFLPAELPDFKLGIDMSSVVDSIGKSGMYSKVPVPRSKRTQLTWFPANSPYYKKVEFWFSEKDRLFMARFGLNEESRGDVAFLKKQFLEKYVGAWLEPKRFRMEPNDMIVYLPEDRDKAPFFEVTNLATGERFLELFDKRIDSEDSPPPQDAGGPPDTSQAPEGQGSKADTPISGSPEKQAAQ